jgi:hypothetical protein
LVIVSIERAAIVAALLFLKEYFTAELPNFFIY